MESLLQYCESDSQRRIVTACIKHGNNTTAAKELDMNLRSLQRTLATVRKNAAKRGWSPEHNMTRTVPEGFVAKGVSTLYDQEGNVRVQWVKSSMSQEDQAEEIKRALAEFLKDHERKSRQYLSLKRRKKIKN